MKSSAADAADALRPSLPVRGAWIEISSKCFLVLAVLGRSPCGERGLKYFIENFRKTAKTSLPVRGAWIEIVVDCPQMQENQRSLPVRGAWIEMMSPRTGRPKSDVAPRAGSVD